MELRTFLEEIPDALIAHDLSGRIVDVNRRACESLGYTREELLGSDVREVEREVDAQSAQAFWERAALGERLTLFGRFRKKDGTEFPVEIHVARNDGDGNSVIVQLAHDISRRKKAEARLGRLKSLYRALSEVNQSILRMEEESTLFPMICRVAVELGGLEMAWVGMQKGRDIVPVARHGEAFPVDSAIARTSIRECRIVIENDFEAAGWGSCAAFPILRGEGVFAVLVVHHRQKDVFDSEIVSLLEEMALDVSFALGNFDREIGRNAAEDALKASEEVFSKIFMSCPNPVSMSTLKDGLLTDVNEAWCRITGYSREEAIGRSALDLGIWMNPEDRDHAVGELERNGSVSGLEIVYRSRRGEKIICLVSAVIIQIKGEPYILIVAQDITELKRAMSTIAEQNNFLSAIFDSEPECVKVVSREGDLLSVNRAGLAMLEVDDPGEVQGRKFSEFILEDHRESFEAFLSYICSGGSGMKEFPVIGRRGAHRRLEVHATPLRNAEGEIFALVAVTRDVTTRNKSAELIWRQANFDALTGLPNRHMLFGKLDQEVERVERSGGGFSLLLIDLDRFKEINDTLGHRSGDLMLVEASSRIASCVGIPLGLARLGGDEFTVVLAEEVDAEEVSKRIISKLTEPFMLDGEVAYISASVGITRYPEDASDAQQLLKNADQAMYAAKNSGRNRFFHFTGELQEKANARLRLFNDLRRGLERKEFALLFQPIVEIASGRIVKAEALLRWKHPERGMVNPAEFVPLAEETGLIVEIGEWVFRESMRIAKRWMELYPAGFQVGINGSAVQFRSGKVDCWPACLEKEGMTGRGIVVEITESLLLEENPEISKRLQQFRKCGMEIAIDDFGTGYSALSYLKKFDIDYLKMDRSFVRDLSTDPKDMALSEAIIVMAHKLGLKVVAEGVETREQRDLLVASGCDYAQGYLFSPPVTAEDFEALMAR